MTRDVLLWMYRKLRATGRGKHVGSFSYYHKSVIAGLPEVADGLEDALRDLVQKTINYNVVKLNSRSRMSCLLYQEFSVSFPALLAAMSVDVCRNRVRYTDYSMRRNPPILHRKELLLRPDDPLTIPAIQLTERLEKLGAFRDTKSIGTREGWRRRLLALGVDADGHTLA